MTHWRDRFIIVVLALAAYAPTLRLGFLWDDHVMIEANPTIRQWTFQNVKHDFTSDVFNGHGDKYYRPAQTLTYRLDYTFWGLRPLGYHLTNLAYHSGNSLLLAEFVLALGFSPLIALITASLFAVHPIAVEQLIIIAGRAELMGFFFSLLTLLLILKKRKIAIGLGCLAYGLALFSKESSVIVPVLVGGVLIYRKKWPQEAWKGVLLLVMTFPYLWLRHQAVGPAFPWNQDPWLFMRFFFQAFPKILWKYASLLLVPWNLHSHRMIPRLSHYWLVYLCFSIGLLAWLLKKRRSLGLFCLGWVMTTLLPKTPVMMFGNFTLDHWAYPALLGILLPLGIFISKCWTSNRRGIPWLGGTAFFGLLIGWSLLVHLNVVLRGTDEKMYRWALYFTRSHPIQHNLGILLLQTGRPAEAIPYLENVNEAYPEDAENANALALAYWRLGNSKRAITILGKVLLLKPEDPATHRHLKAIKSHPKISR